MVQRQAVQGVDPLNLSTGRRAQMVQRAVQQPDMGASSTTRVSGILDALSDFTNTASEAAYKQAQIDVANKKVEGMSLAVSGGKLGAEATKAEQAGYDIVQSQSELGKINEDIASRIEANPDMSDEELTQLKNEKYGGLMAKYQDRAPEVFQAISVKAQESQLAMHKVRVQAQERYRKQKGVETLNYNIGNTLDSAHTIEQGVDLINQFMGQGKQLGLSEFETKDAIMNQMKLSASQGDNRLLQFVKGTDWGKYTVEAKQAQGAYDQYQKSVAAEARAAQAAYEKAVQEQNAYAYGIGLAEIDDMAAAGASDADILNKFKALQSKGMKVSPAMIRGALGKSGKMSESQLALTQNLQYANEGKGLGYNIATNPLIPANDKTKVLDAVESNLITMSQSIPEGERMDWLISNQVRLSKQEGLPVKSIGTALSSLTNLDPTTPMTPAVQNWTKVLLAADDQTIKMNVTNTDDQKFLFGLRDTLINNQGQSEEVYKTAIMNAQSRRDNNVPLNTQQNKKIQQLSKKSVGELRDPTQTTWYGRYEDMPDTVQDYVSSQIESKAKSNYQITGNIEKARDLAMKEWKQNNMVLSGGLVANVGINQLVTQVPELAKGSRDDEQFKMKTVSALDSQVNSLIAAQAKEDGLTYKRSDAQVQFNNSGTAYTVTVGGISVGTYPTAGLSKIYKDEDFKKFEAEQEKQIKASQSYRTLKETQDMSTQLGIPRYR